MGFFQKIRRSNVHRGAIDEVRNGRKHPDLPFCPKHYKLCMRSNAREMDVSWTIDDRSQGEQSKAQILQAMNKKQ
jgi:hypothetical protein